METAESRTSLLIGEMGLQRLKQSCVLVLGVGGVGSYCAEALARSGIGKLILVDGDIVAPSNLNRQIMAQFDTVGQPKTAVMKARIHTYRSDIQITCHQRF
ncbi:MAG: ThiF family adenylyltransferase [Merdibacter sp.]